MEPQPCGDPLFHRGCPHPGWKKSSYDEVVAVNAARDAATYASKDLSLDLISIQFFEPGPLVLLGPDSDKALVQLNGGWFDPHMIGKACHPETTPLPTVWVRTGLSPCLTAAVVLHEARHVWHSQRGTDIQLADEEADATEYMWRSVLRVGFTQGEVAAAFKESLRVRDQG
jgi:hypothetical protein